MPQADLPQGSPLSPILFLLFNATLIQQVINAKGGSLAFVDDYTAWVVGDSAEANTRQLQEYFVNILMKIPNLAIGDNRLVEVSCHFLAHNLSQSRLVDISSILHPWLPTAGDEAMRPFQTQCVFFQQGIRIHRFPSHVSHPQPVSSTHRIFHSLYRSPITSHCIVHSSHRPHNYFFPSLRPSMYNKHSH